MVEKGFMKIIKVIWFLLEKKSTCGLVTDSNANVKLVEIPNGDKFFYKRNKKRKIDDKKCCVFLDKKAEYCFVPCGHLCLCKDCQSHEFSNKKCIICKQSYEMIIKVFDS